MRQTTIQECSGTIIAAHRIRASDAIQAKQTRILQLLLEKTYVCSETLSKIDLQYNRAVYMIRRGKVDGKKHLIESVATKNSDGSWKFGFRYAGLIN